MFDMISLFKNFRVLINAKAILVEGQQWNYLV